MERISVSEYKDKFINYPVSEEAVKQMIMAICEIKIDDDISFEFKGIGERVL